MDDPCYALIRRTYAERRARRSGVLLMDHIDQGLRLLDALGASVVAKRAFCLHPLAQDGDPKLEEPGLDPAAVALAREYARVANAYLSKDHVSSAAEIDLGDAPEVRLLLIADKVQNRKDFLRHHAATHPRAKELARYFALWLERLGIDEAEYARLVSAI